MNNETFDTGTSSRKKGRPKKDETEDTVKKKKGKNKSVNVNKQKEVFSNAGTEEEK